MTVLGKSGLMRNDCTWDERTNIMWGHFLADSLSFGLLYMPRVCYQFTQLCRDSIGITVPPGNKEKVSLHHRFLNM